MKTYTTFILLFGIALVQALPTSTSVKSTSELKDWTNEKKLLTKLRNDSIDDIKQGNRTKKSVICVDVSPPEYDGCPPGCGGQGSPSLQESSMFAPALPSASDFPRPPSAPPSFPYQPTQQRPSMMPSAPQPDMWHAPSAQAHFEYDFESEESNMGPQVPQSQIVHQPPSQSSQQVVDQPAPLISVVKPQAPQPPAVYQPPSQSPQRFIYKPAPAAPVRKPYAPQQQVVYQPPSQSPQRFIYKPAPSTSVVKPQAPQPQVVYQPASQSPQQVTYKPAPQSPQQVVYQPAQFPAFLPPPPPPQIQLPVMRPPQLVGSIPQLPPCPPEEQYLIPGEDSHELISYEMVPVSHHIPSSPSHVITTERPPYPCLPPGAPQPLPPQQSAASFTTVQQQSTVNQLQVVQPNAYAAAPKNYGYSHPSGNTHQQPSSSSADHHQYQQPFGGTQSSQAPENMHMIQSPSFNPSNSQRYLMASDPSMLNNGVYASPNQQQQNTESISSGPSPGYQQAGYQQPMMIVSGHTVDCAKAHPVQYQSSQSVGQSFAAAQSAAYNGYGLASFRSAEDDDGSSHSTIPQSYQTKNSYNHGFSAPSSRFSLYGRNYMHQKRDVTKNGTEKKVKA